MSLIQYRPINKDPFTDDMDYKDAPDYNYRAYRYLKLCTDASFNEKTNELCIRIMWI